MFVRLLTVIDENRRDVTHDKVYLLIIIVKVMKDAIAIIMVSFFADFGNRRSRPRFLLLWQVQRISHAWVVLPVDGSRFPDWNVLFDIFMSNFNFHSLDHLENCLRTYFTMYLYLINIYCYLAGSGIPRNCLYILLGSCLNTPDWGEPQEK